MFLLYLFINLFIYIKTWTQFLIPLVPPALSPIPFSVSTRNSLLLHFCLRKGLISYEYQ